MTHLILITSRFHFKSELIFFEGRLNLPYAPINFFSKAIHSQNTDIYSRQITNKLLLLYSPCLRLRHERYAIMKLLEMYSKRIGDIAEGN